MKKAVKVLLCFDSFKDSLGAKEVGLAVSEGLLSTFSNNKKTDFEFLNIPLSDGGEGFVKSLEPVLDQKDLGVFKHEILGPFPGGERHFCKYLIYKNEMAIMDLASTSGLEMVETKLRNPYNTTTYGLGELIVHVHNHHKIKKILLGVGGSSTNDAGFGALQCMGLEFIPDFLKKDQIFTGKDLLSIKGFKTERKKKKIIEDLIIEIACDVENPFSGEFGAAMVYGKQKGMTIEQQKEMDECMKKLEHQIFEVSGKDLSKIKGTGAAGGISGGFVAFQDASLKPGIALFCEYVQLEEKIKNCDVVVSGEGKYDTQTIFHGKTVSYVEHLAKKHNKPMVIICGKNEIDGKENVFDLNSLFEYEKCMKETKECIIKMIHKNSSKIPFFKDI